MRLPLATAIGLGSNVGDPANAIRQATAFLRDGGVESPRLSPLYRTQAEGCVPGTPDFVNAALVGAWRGSAVELLALCQAIERRMGRPFPHSSHESRVIDLDILLLGECQVRTDSLTVPHPRLLRRLFALVPLAAIAPQWRVPPTGETVAAAARRLGQACPSPPPVRLPDPLPSSPCPLPTNGV